MKPGMIAVLTLLLFVTPAQAESVTLSWDVTPNATGYKLHMTLDNGVTWEIRDVGNVTEYVWENLPLDKQVRWKLSAYNAYSESLLPWYGAWWDYREKPIENTKGLGIK